jgi:hypothetical protein
MTLNIDELYVTSFELGPTGDDGLQAAPRTQGCPVEPYTAAATNCNVNTCITCAVGCQSGTGGIC